MHHSLMGNMRLCFIDSDLLYRDALYVFRFLTSLTPPGPFYWSDCIKQGKWDVMYLCDRYFASFYHFSSGFWNCSDSVVLFFLFFILLIHL